MKRKLTIIIALLSIMSLSACIQSTESESVTKVREAKAAELKSIANLENAQAEAELAIAKAQASLKETEAKVQAAAAEIANAEAERAALEAELAAIQLQSQELQNEAERIANLKAQAELETRLAAAEVAKAEAEQELAQVRAQMEIDAINHETALLNAQHNLQLALDSLNDQELSLTSSLIKQSNAEIDALQYKYDQYIFHYTNIVNNWMTTKSDLFASQQNLIQLENELEELSTSKNEEIAAKIKEIQRKQDQIAALQTYADYTENPEELSNKLGVVYNQYLQAQDALNSAHINYLQAKSNLNLSERTNIQNEIEGSDFFGFLANFSYLTEGVFESYKQTIDFPMYSFYSFLNYPDITENTKIHKADEDNPGEEGVEVGKEAVYKSAGVPDFRVEEINIRKSIDAYTTQINSVKRDYESLKSKYNGLPFVYVYNSETEEYDELFCTGEDAVNLVDKTAKAKAKFEKLLADGATEAEILTAKDAYEAALLNEQNAKNELDILGNNVAEITACANGLLKGLDMLLNFESFDNTLKEKVAAYNEANDKAYAEIIETYDIKYAYEIANEEARNEYLALSYAIYAANSITDQIQILETEIASLTEAINNVAAIESKEAMIANLKEEIAYKEQLIKALEKEIAEAKANIDNIIAQINALAEEELK